MLIVCPSCASRYNLPDDKIGPEGRNVRCAGCAGEWFVTREGAPTPELTADLDAWAQTVARNAEAAAGVEMGFRPTVGPDRVSPATDDTGGGAVPGADDGSGGTSGEPADASETLPAEDAADETATRDIDDVDVARAAAKAALQATTDTPKGWRRFLPRLRGRRPADTAPRAKRPGSTGQQLRGSRPIRRKASGSGSGARLARPLAVSACGFALLAGLVMMRERVVNLLPRTAPVYAALGLPVNLVGLDFSDVRSQLVAEADGRYLLVEGRISNVTEASARVPPIEVRLRDSTQRTVYSWTTEPPRSSLRPGEALHFRTRLATPPEAGRDVEVVFARRLETARAQR